MLVAIEDLVDGKIICGVGGFLQVIFKEVFQDSDINVWDSELIW